MSEMSARKQKRPKLRAKERQRIAEILRVLGQEYADANCALHHQNAYELLVATVLSAQCTDVRVNMVTPALFQRFSRCQSFGWSGPGRVAGDHQEHRILSKQGQEPHRGSPKIDSRVRRGRPPVDDRSSRTPGGSSKNGERCSWECLWYSQRRGSRHSRLASIGTPRSDRRKGSEEDRDRPDGDCP